MATAAGRHTKPLRTSVAPPFSRLQSMKVLYDADEPIGNPTSATIGNFDGVHMGHKRILAAVKQSAAEKGVGSCVITFHPHPQKVLRNIDVPLLLPMRERLRLLEA